MARISNQERLEKFLSRKLLKKEDINSPTENYSYAIVRNIPKELHSRDLRKYFNLFIEENKFACFHYRHRPELQAENEEKDGIKKETCCCIIAFNNNSDREEFVKEFHKRNWSLNDGTTLERRCFVDRLKVSKKGEESTSSSVTENDIKDMIELKPPAVMPQGNIGTTSAYFREQIRLCKLPTSVIKKLGIETGRRKKEFEAVPFDYESSTISKQQYDPNECYNKDDVKKNVSQEQQSDRGADESDNDNCEEWERHEALHEDVSEQERVKPKKYEEEMEVTWEKGGPGLVWYTDKNYWDEREKGTDCDWAWADDWDVDYSVYYEGKSAGDLDAKASIEISEDDLLRTGKLEKSVFKKSNLKANKSRKRSRSTDLTPNFESKYANKILLKMGWKPGTGLGKHEQGKTIPVACFMEEEGQSGKEKVGFGYRGPKLLRFNVKKEDNHCITSIYDNKEEPMVGVERNTNFLLRRDGPDFQKYTTH